MGRWRGRAAATCALGALALPAIGCGAEEHVSSPRPQPPTRISVAITKDAITLQPSRVGIGPEPQQQLPQNRHASQPAVSGKAPLSVALVTANLTRFESQLELRGPRKSATSGKLVPNGNGTLQVDLPTGEYRVTAADIPSARPATLVVGPYRTSSQNDVLLP
jgi:hypothetical protein